MSGVVIVDTNLMVLLVVGSASKRYVKIHKRLKDYTTDDFELLGLLLADFSDIILLPHILSETSSIVRQIDNPARRDIQRAFKTLIMTAPELPILSSAGVQRDEFDELGLTDVMILHLCSLKMLGVEPTLITTDTDLANSANSMGYSVIDYKRQFQDGIVP